MHRLSILTFVGSMLSLSTALTSTFTNVTTFTSGPTAAGMYVYVPTTVLSSAPIIVAIHWCGGSASGYFADTLYATYADTYGHIAIYPDSPSSDKCWDVASLATLTHNGGGDSLTIVNMVKYAVANYGGDIDRVYATGISSGAMMTNVLAGAYPDIFKAGSVYSGVPDGCFYVSSATAGMAQAAWNETCSEGDYIQTAAQWGALTRSYYPGYTGSYPKMAIYHGTADFTLAYINMAQELLQWSNLLSVSFSYNLTNTPQANYTKMVYGDGTKLFGVDELDVGHPVSCRAEDDLVWFGIMSASTASTMASSTSSTVMSSSASSTKTAVGTTSSKTTSTSLAASATITGGGGTAAHWAQCGGIGYTGPTTCASSYTCTYSNEWYSQCL